ncbi:Do family serine endopeptidase [Qipengyuania sp. DY56-A-20]|uniref:Probable periplasmic serine endoprotease DegP-like n=1 Tax=Qipengyuania benthica TaxID=3067651 RepID=A0ABT9H4X2_9SPHN|nr:Do family serine endopeptidase [Qipengyuania sp. DY56-A-20]MBU1253463.1 Do family serine endopeptidase [Alphaproteobacteria bacterium]MBU1606541.1 Do family serine endopeptidase [Alphaproteobacteria bacterium]MDP4538371.1 Do family serine endopeptidase [Qipengyuania sp. DY56-A-20]
MRYAYGLTSVLLVGGAAVSLATGYPAGAQVAQNDGLEMSRAVPRAGGPESFAELTAQLQPAVVNISTRQRVEVSNANPFAGTPFENMFNRRRGQSQDEPQYREGQSLGSGFIISADGYVVTNNHVVSPRGRGTVEEITVTMPDGTEYAAKLVGNDADSDLAVLKIVRGEPFPFVRFGDSSQARVGDWVVAIGNPFGLGGTVTSGIVSSVLRNTGTGAYDRFIQTDASINTGNSGGPLFDMQGNVIGINNAILSPSGGSVGIGFAIPAETAAPIVEQLVRGETIERGYLGISIQPVTDDLAASLGIERNRGEIVQSVQPGEGAERAGIRPGDIVVSVNGQPVTPDQTLSFLVANIPPGETIPVELIRGGERMRVNVPVGRRPSAEELARQQMFDPEAEEEEMLESPDDGLIEQRLGLQVVPLNPQIARQLGASPETQGLAVGAVDANSDAARKGLQRGDVILSANYREVADIAGLEAVIAQADAEDRDAVLLRVQRRGRPPTYLPVRLR